MQLIETRGENSNDIYIYIIKAIYKAGIQDQGNVKLKVQSVPQKK